MAGAYMQSDFDSETVANRLKEEIARRRISRQGLAETARLSISTLEKALSGRRPFTLATIVRLEEALGSPLRDAPAPAAPAPTALAPVEMGSYARPAVQWIEGKYITLRSAFSESGAIYAYRTEIAWDEDKGHLTFAESKRADAGFAQAGFVSLPHLSGHTYLVTSESGQYRMAMLGRATRDRRMFGLLSTLQQGAGSQLLPVACPIALVPEDQLGGSEYGIIREGDAEYADYRAILDTATTQDFCRIHP